MRKIYLDNASGTPLDPEVKIEVTKAFNYFQNPSALHEEGIAVRSILEEARKKIAGFLGAHADEIIFTSSGTEANNLALNGRTCIVTTNIEHPSVMEKAKKLNAVFVPVEQNGIVDLKKLKEAIKPETDLISVIYANNEIGTIEPIREIAKIIRFKRKEYNKPTPYFHTDAVQAINYLPIEVEKLGVDLLTFNGSKIYGPRGIGVLYKRRGVPITPIMFGGNQEKGMRPGTENLPAILGLVKALEIVNKIKEKESKRLTKLRDYFFNELEKIEKVEINGDRVNRLPNNVNISIPGFQSDVLVLELAAYGVSCSSRSACKEGSADGSHVIEAIRPKEKASSLRFSLGRGTRRGDIDYAVDVLKRVIGKYEGLRG